MPQVIFKIALNNTQFFAPGTEGPTQLHVVASQGGETLGEKWAVVVANPVPVGFDVPASGNVHLVITPYNSAGQIGEAYEQDQPVQLAAIGLPSGVSI